MRLHRFCSTSLIAAAATGLIASSAAASIPDPFYTQFDPGQERFQMLPGAIVTEFDGKTPEHGDLGYLLGRNDYIVFDFDTQFPGVLEMAIYDTGFINLDEEGEPDGSVNLRGPRWGAWGLDEEDNARVAGAALEYRTFLNVNEIFGIAEATGNNPASGSTWFSMAFGGPLVRAPGEWIIWEFDFTTDDMIVTATYEDGSTASRTYSLALDDLKGSVHEEGHGPRGFYLFGGSDANPDLYIDYISYTPIPEPGTIALAGLGGLVLLMRRRR